MGNIDRILEIYYRVSRKKIDVDDLVSVLPKVQLMLTKIKLDNVEIVNLIDVLVDIKKVNMLDKVTSESLDLIVNSVCEDNGRIDRSIYLPLMVRHILLPYNVNRCDNKNELLLFLSQYEMVVELIIKFFKEKDYIILEKYNPELADVIDAYRNTMRLYKTIIGKEYVLCNIIAHMSTMLYFKLDEYNFDYGLVEETASRLMDNYDEFIDYCQKEDILDNFRNYFVSMENIQKEYVVSEKFLKYTYENKNGKGKSK